MNITITGRQINVSDGLGEYAEKKIKKLETYFHQLMDAHVIFYKEKLDKGAEVIINGDGIQFHGREKSENLHSAIDLLFEKMEKQIIKYKEKHSSHKAVNVDKNPVYDFTSTAGKEVVLNQVSNRPLDRIEAFLQMKLANRDFILFKKGMNEMTRSDYAGKCYAVIFREQGSYRMLDIPAEHAHENGFEPHTFEAYDLNVKDETPARPDIEFRKSGPKSVNICTLDQAIQDFEKSNDKYMTFFNTESQYFNIIYRKGNRFEVLVPAF